MKKHPALKFAVIAADSVLFSHTNGELQVLVMKVHRPPYFKNIWGLPGGLIHPKETAEEAARRHLERKGGIKSGYYLEQLYTFSRINRDPRGRVVSVAYLGLCNRGHLQSVNKKLLCETKWIPVETLPRLAYDHNEIIKMALLRLRAKLAYTNIAFTLLPHEFTLSELQDLYEDVLGKKLDKRNFRKKFLHLKLLKEANKEKRSGAYRPAKLYDFHTHILKIVEVL